jgi:hypothetical protein
MRIPGGFVDFTKEHPNKEHRLNNVVQWAKKNHCWFKKNGLGRYLSLFIRRYMQNGIATVVNIFPDFCKKSFILEVNQVQKDVGVATLMKRFITIGLIFDESTNTWSSHS